ncbi:MAG: Do family serine endopeptidase [Campylobacterales bacterium]|nr:Do family serine endopeptidase [Campylobacterales bacterium]
MKKTVLFLALSLSFLYANDNIEFNHSQTDSRKFPTSQEYILSYNNVIEKVKTSVVNISTQKNVNNNITSNPFMNDPFFREFFRNFGPRDIPQERIQRALGSGVIVSSDGYIVTNNHVVDGADKIVVSLVGDKKEYEAKLIGKDKKSDLAVIKIDAKNLNAITFYNSDKVKVGDITFAIGNPFGLNETITQGIVSATRRSGVGIVEYEDFIQTDASINPGNSGGALVNSAGELIGINSAILSKSGGNVGIGFAIPSNMVSTIASSLIKNGKYIRAYLGVNISDVSEDMSDFYNNNFGALITGVEDNTPAQKAGLKRGDLIISVDGKEVKSASELKNIVGSFKPNTTVKIKFLRDKKVKTVDVKLDSFDNASTNNGDVSYKGISVIDTNDGDGVLVSEVDPDSKAAMIGITKGDIIVQVETTEIKNIKDFIKATKGDMKKRIYIFRRGGIFAIVL